MTIIAREHEARRQYEKLFISFPRVKGRGRATNQQKVRWKNGRRKEERNWDLLRLTAGVTTRRTRDIQCCWDANQTREVTKALKINVLLHPLLPRDNSHRWNRTRGKRVAPGFTFIVTRELYGKDRGEREGTLTHWECEEGCGKGVLNLCLHQVKFSRVGRLTPPSPPRNRLFCRIGNLVCTTDFEGF